MKKAFVLCMLLLLPIQSFAEEDSFWTTIRKKIENITPKKKIATTTAVGGVRGSLAAADDLYWMGEAVHDVDAAELDAFKHAVMLADTGKKDDAMDSFEKFLKDFPYSQLRSDARAAIAQLE